MAKQKVTLKDRLIGFGQYLLFTIIFLGCAVLAYMVGDMLIEASDIVRPTDLAKFRLGAPIVGAIIGLVIGIQVNERIETWLNR